MKILILGDVVPTFVTDPLFKNKDVETLFGDSVSIFKGNDVNFVNLECALTESDTAIKKFGPNLKGCPETAEVFASVGVNVCGISNNHVYDFGQQGATDTIEALEKNGIRHTGFGRNYADSRRDLILEFDGERVAVIAVCEHEYSYALPDRMGSRPYDEATFADIIKAKNEYGHVIVIYHGGKEFCRYPSPRLRRLCRAMVDCGADAVICQHSHCVGCYEEYNGSHILYGQGNAHFVKPHKQECWRDGLAVRYDTVSRKMEFVCLAVNENGIELAKGDRLAEIENGFAERNAELQDGRWLEGWRAFCREMAPAYTKVVKNAGTDPDDPEKDHFFAHYLDCEAHTDVWRELYKTAHLDGE